MKKLFNVNPIYWYPLLTHGHLRSHVLNVFNERIGYLLVKTFSFLMEFCNFTHNTADTGGGVSIFNIQTVIIRQCKFHNNNADANGGSLILRNIAFVNITDCSFIGNRGDTGMENLIKGKLKGLNVCSMTTSVSLTFNN